MIAPAALAQLVAAAYQPDVQSGVSGPDLSAAPGWQYLWPLYAIDQNKGPVCYGFGVQDPESNIVLSVRGTQTNIEWIEDAEIALVPNPWGPGRVHSGFARLAASLGVGVACQDPRSVLASFSRVYVAGHSLGAAIARLLTYRFGLVGGIFTWGEPKSGDQTAAQWGLSCAGWHHRGVNEKDLVCQVPEYVPLVFPFVHAAPEITLGKVGDSFEQAHNLQGTYIPLELAQQPPVL